MLAAVFRLPVNFMDNDIQPCEELKNLWCDWSGTTTQPRGPAQERASISKNSFLLPRHIQPPAFPMGPVMSSPRLHVAQPIEPRSPALPYACSVRELVVYACVKFLPN